MLYFRCMTQEKLISRLKKALLKQPIRLAYLYGSQATGKTHAKSDIDIAVVLEKGVLMHGFEIAYDVKLDAGVESEVDIRAIDEDKPLVYLRNILTKGKLILAKSEKERVNFEVRVMKKYYDSEYLRNYMSAHMYKTIKEGTYGHRQTYN